MRVAIRLQNPLVGSAATLDTIIDGIVTEVAGGRAAISPAIAGAVRTTLLRQGYDGIIVSDGGGDGVDYVIALRDKSVKVVTL